MESVVFGLLFLGGICAVLFLCGYLISSNKAMRSELEFYRTWRDSLTSRDSHPLDGSLDLEALMDLASKTGD